MPDRKSLVSTLWPASSLALLVSVLFAPIRTSEFAVASSQPAPLDRSFALPPGQPTTHFGAALGTDTVVQVNALPFENEEQDRVDTLDEPQVAFRIACSFRNIPDRRLVAPRSIPSLYPLRC